MPRVAEGLQGWSLGQITLLFPTVSHNNHGGVSCRRARGPSLFRVLICALFPESDHGVQRGSGSLLRLTLL